MRNTCRFVVLSASILVFCGCVPLLVAGVGVVTGYVAFKDTAAGNVEASFDDVWRSAVGVLEERATIGEQDKDRGTVKAVLEDGLVDVYVKIVPLAKNSYKLKVTARRRFAVADLEAAQNVFTAIIRDLPKADSDGSPY